MEAYAQALSYAIPGFLLLIIIEALVARSMGMRVNRSLDVISSLSSGVTNTLKSLLGLTVVIVSYEWMVDRLAIFEIPNVWWVYLIAFVGLDFAGYWSHRWNHEVNVFWNRHIIHHSSEEFNLSCALRQQISAFIGIYFFLYIPMAIIGVPAQVVAIVAPIHFFAQFWYHTRLIGRMGWLEHVIVTPSHHRVHHAINPEYIDKNYSEIFILWDKWFGTFQPELDEVPPVYGVKKPVRTWNPILINFMHLWQIIKDSFRAKRWQDKVKVWFKRTGWRPKDVESRHPVPVIEDVYAYQKYETHPSALMTYFSWAQLGIAVVLMYYMMLQIAELSYSDLLWYSLFLFLSVFSYTSLMDGHRMGLAVETVKCTLGLILIYQQKDWFGLSQFIPGAASLMISLLLISLALAWYLFYFERRHLANLDLTELST